MRNFIALNNEAKFARSVLGIGVTEIRKANFCALGIYWQAFTNLSVGLERLAKLVILLNLLIQKKGIFPTDKELKKYGHDLEKLYQESKNIIQQHQIQIDTNLDGEIYQNILKVLNGFAKGDRYSNLDFLTGNLHENAGNPIESWASLVDDWIWENKISVKQQERIYSYAEANEQLPAVVFHFSERNEIIDNLYDYFILRGIWRAVAPYRCLYMTHIIRYWASILIKLQNICQRQDIKVPFFNEIYALFLINDDKYCKNRKTWTRNY